MPSLEDVLHDGIDDQEELAERARAVVDRLRPRLATIMGELDDIEGGLTAIAALVADELADITTEAVQAGRRLAHKVAAT